MTAIRTAFVAAALFGATVSFAQSPVGKWAGKMDVKMPPLPANMPPEQKASVMKMLDNLKKTVFSVDFKANKSCSMTAQGPLVTGASTQTGTWKQTGKAVTITATNPKTKKTTTQVANFSADGKTLTITQTTPMGTATMTLKKAK